MQTLLITGTDTDVGKTVLTSAIAAYWQKYRSDQSLGLMKLMQTGIGDDEHYQKLFSFRADWDIVTPQKWETPVAPAIAAEKEGKAIALDLIWQSLVNLQKKHSFVLVEALGSLGSPITPELTVADLAGLWKLEAVLVVPVRLGCMGAAIAQVVLARQHKIKLRGLVLNCHSLEAEEKLQDWASPA
ncbi:MAG: dethiobiotin synthase, partial [Microcystaceae cyanobacterium]